MQSGWQHRYVSHRPGAAAHHSMTNSDERQAQCLERVKRTTRSAVPQRQPNRHGDLLNRDAAAVRYPHGPRATKVSRLATPQLGATATAATISVAGPEYQVLEMPRGRLAADHSMTNSGQRQP